MSLPNHCKRCGEVLREGAEVWLELDTRTRTYTDAVPAEHSQGGFPFGKKCAAAERLRWCSANVQPEKGEFDAQG